MASGLRKRREVICLLDSRQKKSVRGGETEDGGRKKLIKAKRQTGFCVRCCKKGTQRRTMDRPEGVLRREEREISSSDSQVPTINLFLIFLH